MIFDKGLVPALKPFFPGCRVEALGPFGICSRVAIHVYDDRLKPDVRESWPKGYCRGLELTPGDIFGAEPKFEGCGLLKTDYSRNTGQFAKGTIGQLNGMNHPNVPLPANLTVAELAKLICE